MPQPIASFLLTYLVGARAMPDAEAALRYVAAGLRSLPGVASAGFVRPGDPLAPDPGDAPVRTFPVRFQGEEMAALRVTFRGEPSQRTEGDLANACNLLALELVRRTTEARLQAEVEARTAELRRLLDDARERDRSRMVFLGHVSHELRTPINALAGFLQIMADEMYGPIGNEKYRDYVAMLLTASQRLAGIVDGFLRISALSVDEETLSFAAADPAEVADHVVQLLSPIAAGNGVALACDVAPGRFSLRMDAAAVAQALINLVNNALKFTPRGGRVDVVGRPGTRPGEAEIAVADDGPGIQPTDVERLLRPFQQSHQVRHEQAGVGLGLPITARIMERHGGRLAFGRAPGGRFEAVLVFPAA